MTRYRLLRDRCFAIYLLALWNRNTERSGDSCLVASRPDITEREKRDLVGRVLQSPAFSSSRALQAFLQFITEHAIAGDFEAIKEQRIGREVLGRKSDYDPAADNIVRVRAHELRQKLAKFFTAEGADEPFVITIPRGSYVPAFVPRPSSVAVPHEPEVAPTPPRRAFAIPPWIPWSLAGVLTVAMGYRAMIPDPLSATNTHPGSSVVIRDLWSQFFRDGRELTLVSADSGFALWQDMTGQSVELGDYITKKFVQGTGGNEQLGEVASRLCTSPADLSVALEVAEVSMAFRGRVRHRYSRDMTAAELRIGNAVLMGSRRSNPWVGLFESRMNFVLGMGRETGAPHFHNKAPRPGELTDFAIPSRFDSAGAEKHQMVSYAVAALVPNLSGSGLVLIVEGLSMEGTAAVGHVLTDPEKLENLLHKVGHKPGTTVKPFEALIKLTSVPGGFAYPEVIAARTPTL